MQISHRYKFIFFSFPKTGSESVRALLEPYSDIEVVPFWERSDEKPFYSHISPVEVKQLFEKNDWDYDSYYKFTFIRNPWARQVSLYNMIYHTSPARSMLGSLKLRLTKRNTPSFKQWLQTTRTDGNGAGGPADQRWQVYGSYSIASYIFDGNNNMLVDQVIKLEEVDSALPLLLKRLGIPEAQELVVPRVNTRTVKKYSSYFDVKSRDLIAQRYKYDIENYGYSFNELL